MQRVVVIVAKAGYLPLVQLLLLPLDCSTDATGTLVLDADPSRSCWDNPGHIINAAAGLAVAAVYTVIAARVVLAGGQLPNVEFHGLRLWDRSYDTFQPQVGGWAGGGRRWRLAGGCWRLCWCGW